MTAGRAQRCGALFLVRDFSLGAALTHAERWRKPGINLYFSPFVSRGSPVPMAPKLLKTRRKYFAPGLQNISPLGAEWA